MPHSSTIHSVRQSPSLLLLVSLVVLLLAIPYAEASAFTSLLVNVLLAFVMLAAVPAVAGHALHRTVALSMTLAWLALTVWEIATPNRYLALGTNAVFLAFSLFAVIVLLRRTVKAETVDFEVLFASPSIYLLLAMAWAVCYDMLHLVAPGSFNLTAEGGAPEIIELLYFSLTTITTLGYGDVTPLSSTARIWAMLEAMVGQFYLAMLVARLVSLYRH